VGETAGSGAAMGRATESPYPQVETSQTSSHAQEAQNDLQEVHKYTAKHRNNSAQMQMWPSTSGYT
jgi:hypothetical protein